MANPIVTTPITWDALSQPWNDASGDNEYLRTTGHLEFTWDEVFLVQAALGGGGEEMPWTGWQGEKKKRLVKLICKVQGKTYKNTKPVKDYKIKISDVKLVAKKVLGIEIMTENIKF